MKHPVWDRHAIMAAVRRKGKSLRRLAMDVGIEISACRVALHRRNIAGERAISAFLGVPLNELWPDRYWGPHQSHRKANSEARRSTSQKRVAA